MRKSHRPMPFRGGQPWPFAGLTAFQERVYIRLMWIEWSQGTLTNDAEWLRRRLSFVGLPHLNNATVRQVVDDLTELGKLVPDDQHGSLLLRCADHG